MSVRYLGFVLLVWFPGALHAQSATKGCSAPPLSDGYLVPEKETYSHGTTVKYACGDRLKPAVEGWWATSKCENGQWSHTPHCIDEDACFPPEIPHADIDPANQNGWYENGLKIRITCHKGYEPKDRAVTATCENGTWSSVPVCKNSTDACGDPPKIPHAVIINQTYQEVFAADSRVQYECEDGYTVEGADSQKSIVCIAGSWGEGPTCRPSTTSGLDNTRPLLIPIKDCGAHPIVPNVAVVQVERMFLKYQCSHLYTQVGSDTVTCHNDGSWSELPICKEAGCVLDLAQYRIHGFQRSGVENLAEGEEKSFLCTWQTHRRFFHCTKGRIIFTTCCHNYDIERNLCQYRAAE